MIGDLGAPELLIIFAIVILLFGAGKVGRLGKDLGTAIREFRTAVQDDKHDAPINLLSAGEAAPPPVQPANQPLATNGDQRPPSVF